jgi:hypothetical protein
MVPPEGEHLTTGWEADLPPEDTLVRQAVLVHASWPVAVAGAAGRPRRSAARWAGGWIGDRGALTNPVILTQPMTRAEDVLEEINALFPPDVPYLLLNPWPTPDLGEHGLTLIGHPPLMVRFPGPPPPLRRWPGEVREIRDPTELTVAERVLVEGYPMPELDPLTPGDLLGPRSCRRPLGSGSPGSTARRSRWPPLTRRRGSPLSSTLPPFPPRAVGARGWR